MKKALINVNCSESLGALKKVHGVVNGPYNDTFPFTDITERYQEAGVPFVRLHDTLYPNPPEVDISVVFPNFEADPDDPLSYDFAKTDVYLENIHKTGAEIRYRLGESIEKHRIKRHITPPSDPQKWAKICVMIAKHYNDGWANGFHYNIKVWEIWEEPDGTGFLWFGTDEQFYELYRYTAVALKEYDPELIVGGFAMCDMYGRDDFLRGFLKYIKEYNVPFDFFSYDHYANDPEEYITRAQYARKVLCEYGFDHVPLKLCEWNNYGFDPQESRLFEGSPELLTWKLERQHGLIGTAFYAASMIRMQESELQDAAVYVFNASSEFSMFNLYGLPYKAFYAFVAYNHVYSTKKQVQVITNSDRNIYCVAGCNDDSAAILVSNFTRDEEENCEYQINMSGLDQSARYTSEFFIIDEIRNLEPIGKCTHYGNIDFSFMLSANHVILIKVTKQ